MGHHTCSNTKNSQYNNCNHRYAVPTPYGHAVSFTCTDLGKQSHFEGQPMQRSNSSISNTDSQDSALDVYGAPYMYRDNSQPSNSAGYSSAYPLLEINPAAVHEPGIKYITSPVDTHQLQPTSSAAYFDVSYAADWMIPRTEIVTYQQSVSSPVSAMSPGLQQSGTQESQPAKYPCLICTQSFARQADLKRHYDHKHSPVESLDQFYCDYKQCLRSESGYRQALERMGQPPRDKVSGIGPFTRKDHFKAHLREQHQEALPKRDPKNDPGWLDGKIMKEDWWRCVKCLKRVWIQKQRDEKRNEYTCCNCATPCDQEVLNARQRIFHSASTLTSVLTTSRKQKR